MNGRKILITGAHGMLGSSLVNLLPYEMVAFSSKELDVTNSEQCSNLIESEKPDIIIHTAAYTDVEGCETDPIKAYQVNTIGTQNLVNCCIDKKILFIFISSTGVYGTGKEKEPYSEFDKAEPTSIHHKSKYEAEKNVQNHLKRYLILRTGWLFGGEKEHNKNFVYKRYLEAKNSHEIFSDGTQIGNPTYIDDLVNQIEILIEKEQFGTFNCVNKAVNVSRYDYVKKVVDYLGLNCSVKKASSDEFKRIAKVSKNESAINYKLEILGINMMSDWDEALEKYLIKIEI